MKLKNSVLLPILYLFILFYILLTIVVVERSNKSLMEKIYNQTENTSRICRKQMEFIIEFSDEYILKDLFNLWDKEYSVNGTFFLLLGNKEASTYYTFPYKEYPKLLKIIEEFSDNKPLGKSQIIDINNKKYLFFIETDYYPYNPNKTFSFVVIQNITNIERSRANNYIFFTITGVVLIIIFYYIIGALISLNLKPLKALSKSTELVESGIFTTVPMSENTAEEIILLTKNYNSMSAIIRNQIELLKEENSKRKNFVNSLTHELNTPLTSIIGHANLLNTLNLTRDKQQEGVSYIYREGKRMMGIIDQLFTLIVDSNLKREEINSEELLFKSAENWKSEAEKREVEILIKGESFNIDGNIDLLNIALGNIIHNSLKAIRKIGKIYIDQDPVKKIIKISDTGCGVLPENLKNIQKPFIRENKGDKGLGLGISITKEILEKHSFKMDFQQIMNKGLTVIIKCEERIWKK